MSKSGIGALSATTNPRSRALFVSKKEQRWHPLFVEKFADHYELRTVYICDHVPVRGYSGFVDWLNGHIEETSATIVFLDIEYGFGFGLDLILRIAKSVRIILTTFDDITFHEINYINALGCDLVTCADPIAVMKYREKRVKASLLFLENSRRMFDEFLGNEKDIDVLFYGWLLKGGRAEFLEKLAATGIAITVHSPGVDAELSYRDLARLISRAKIVLNLSQTDSMVRAPEAFVPVGSYSAFKGRVIEAGLAGAACVSEYAPSIEYMFGQDTVPMFKSAGECSDIIRGMLGNPVRLNELSGRLRETVLEQYEEFRQVGQVVGAIEALVPVSKATPQWIPYRYIALTVAARFQGVGLPLRGWCRDLWDFVFFARVYPLPLRLLAVSVKGCRMIMKRILVGIKGS